MMDAIGKCRCGCGEETQHWFAPGHDAKAKSMLLKVKRGQMTLAEISPMLIDFVQNEGPQWWRDDYGAILRRPSKERNTRFLPE